MTGYAKDVAAKISSSTRVMPNPNGVDSRRSEGKHGTPTRQTSSAEKQRHKSSDFKANEPKLWSVKDVLDWLEHISLPAYKQVFEENAVDGAILLDLSLDDLDYMQITALGTVVVTTLHTALTFTAGHRKTILKGIEELRRNKRITLRASSVSSQSSKETLPRIAARVAREEPSKGRSSKAEDDLPPAGGAKVHWSELELLSNDSSRVSDKPAAIRLSDGALDEDAERAAFQAAVMEWRRAGKAPTQSVLDDSPKLDKDAEVEERVLYAGRRSLKAEEDDDEARSSWRDPFSSHEEAGVDEAKEHEVAL